MLFNLKSSVAVLLCLAVTSSVNAAPVKEQSIIGDLIGDVAWPIGFSNQCSALSKISAGLDQVLVRIHNNHNWSCSEAVRKAIGPPKTCFTLDVIAGLAWPAAFAEQQAFAKRISAQIQCISEYPKI